MILTFEPASERGGNSKQENSQETTCFCLLRSFFMYESNDNEGTNETIESYL